jgi:hypothetical protein
MTPAPRTKSVDLESPSSIKGVRMTEIDQQDTYVLVTGANRYETFHSNWIGKY